jgi:anti-anti-sigma factor
MRRLIESGLAATSGGEEQVRLSAGDKLILLALRGLFKHFKESAVMALQVTTAHIEPDIAVMRISGNMTFEETGSLASPIRALLDHGVKKLVLDLSGVEQIDSLGGVSVIRSYFEAREANAALCVAGCIPSVMRLFQATHADTSIPFFPTMALAHDHFTVAPKARPYTA